MIREETLDAWWGSITETGKETVRTLIQIVRHRAPEQVVELRPDLLGYDLRVALVAEPGGWGAGGGGRPGLARAGGGAAGMQRRAGSRGKAGSVCVAEDGGLDEWWRRLTGSEKGTVYLLMLAVHNMKAGEVVKIRSLHDRILLSVEADAEASKLGWN